MVSRRPRITATSGLIGDACLSLRSSRSTSLWAAGDRRPSASLRAYSAVSSSALSPASSISSRITRSFSCRKSCRCALSMRCCTLLTISCSMREHRVLLGESLDQGEEALLRGFHLQERLLLRRVDLQVRGHHVGDLLGVVGLAHHVLRLVGELRVELHVVHELGGHAARQRAAAHERAIGRRQRRGAHEEERLGTLEALDAHALLALDERLDAAVRQLEELQHADARADGHDVVGGRILHRRLALRAEDERGLLVEGRLDGLDGLLAAHEEGRDHLGEDDQLAGRQQRQGRRRRARANGVVRAGHVALRQTRRHAAAPPSPPR